MCFSRKNKLIIAIFKKKVMLNLLYENHCRAKEMIQKNQMHQQSCDFTILGREDSLNAINISKKRKKKLTRRQKMNQIQVEGIMEEKMDALEIENSDDEELMTIKKPKSKEGEMDKDGLAKFKEHLIKVMENNGFGQERASKMHWSKFLELLQILNANEIYFR
jgi:homospermidine synthase